MPMPTLTWAEAGSDRPTSRGRVRRRWRMAFLLLREVPQRPLSKGARGLRLRNGQRPRHTSRRCVSAPKRHTACRSLGSDAASRTTFNQLGSSHGVKAGSTCSTTASAKVTLPGSVRVLAVNAENALTGTPTATSSARARGDGRTRTGCVGAGRPRSRHWAFPHGLDDFRPSDSRPCDCGPGTAGRRHCRNRLASNQGSAILTDSEAVLSGL